MEMCECETRHGLAEGWHRFGHADAPGTLQEYEYE